MMPQKNKLFSILDSDIFDSLSDAVLLIDKQYNVIYANNLFKKKFDHNSADNKCYQLIGRNAPCQICTCSLSSKKKSLQEKEEKVDNRFYAVSSNMISKNLTYESFYIETYKDITYNKDLEDSLTSKNVILEDNLNIARQVQQSLLPQPISLKNIKFSYRYLPCEKLGGDFFNIYSIDENTYGMFIADVSGHGVSAAMLTMFLNSSYDKTERSPAKILTDLFKSFNSNKFLIGQYITLFYAIIDLATQTIKYCNAGLNSIPIIFDNKSKNARFIESSGFPISNWVEDPEYEDSIIPFDHHEKFLFYTDGITDAKNKSGNQYGQERLIRSLLDGNPSTKLTLDRIISYLEDFIENDICTLNDDVSLMIVEPK